MVSQEEKKDSVKRAKISQILMEGETLLTSCNPINLEDPIRGATPAPDNGLDRSFSIENKSYQFASDNESFLADTHKGPFETKGPINKKLADKILFKEIKFSSPPRRGSKYRRDLGPTMLMDPDDSLDIETGTFQRKRMFTPQEEKDLAEEDLRILKEMPEPNEPLSALPGFKTAEGSSLYISKECAEKGRRSLDFLQKPFQKTFQKTIQKKPKKILPREKELQDMIKVYNRVKQEIFPLTRTEEEEYNIFSLFKWTWISMLPHIHEIQKRGGESQESEIEKILLLESKKRWKADPKSVLRRIVERDEAPSIYMKVLVVEKSQGIIKISDGIHSIWAKLDDSLQRVSNKITVGLILQVASSYLLNSHAVSVWEASTVKVPTLQLCYNGVKPCTSGPLGYQPTVGYIRELSSIKMHGGYTSFLLLKVTRHIDTAYIVNIKGSKTVIEEERIDSTLQRIEKSIESLDLTREEKMKEFDTVKLHKYKRYEVACDYSHSTTGILSLWEPAFNDNNLRVGKRYLFFMLTTPKKGCSSEKILLSTTSQTAYRVI